MQHYGVKGQKWGVRRFQNEDGTLTAEGKARYGYDESTGKMSAEGEKQFKKDRLKIIKQDPDIRKLKKQEYLSETLGGRLTYGYTAKKGKEVYDKISEKYGKEIADDYSKDHIKKMAGMAAVATILGIAVASTPMVIEAIKSKN